MDRTAAAPAASGGPTRSGVIAAALVLLVLSFWAFSEDTTRVTTEAGIRVSPRSAYNPVTAGERLPDGFRQLLPRDAIKPIYNPEFLSASSIGWPDETHVIGVTLGGEAKAYPVSFLNGRELVVDELDNIPILVSW